MIEATLIFLGVVFIVWTLASLYYHSTKELRLLHTKTQKIDKNQQD